ncbi:probable cytochrome P450 6a14 [Chironomus tepperi]|uniref:probable cytochrome P450 6a14 n=1 Tax=Chironomus tepperi TaxID=113505 RepID=UPI00391F29F9
MLPQILLSILLIIITCCVYYVRKKYSQLEKLGFMHEKPKFPFGNVQGIGKKYHLVDILRRTYKKFSSDSPIHGLYMFLSANFVVTDLDLAKDILIKDFDTFHNRGLYHSIENDPLTNDLTRIEDQEWRNMRHKLTPTFTSGKMKIMFSTILELSHHMLNKLKANENLDNVEIKEVIASFMTDVIGNVAFGLEMNAIEDPDSKFRVMGRKIFTSQNFLLNLLFLANFKSLAIKLKLRQFPTDLSDFFLGVVRETIEYRLKNNIERNDVLNSLMKIGTEGRKGEDKLSTDEIAAQCFAFFIGGFETSSTTTTFTLYHLVQNTELQEKLRDEIKAVLSRHDNKVTYEAMQDMKYLDMVINETLRMCPPGTAAIRQASKNYKVPKTSLEIPKGPLVIVPIYMIHNDPKYHPKPEQFNPERFTPENKAKRHPMAFIPFGDGPRICIGNRFAVMQTKIALIQLLTSFRAYKTSKTPDKIVIDPKSSILNSVVPIFIRLEEL